jgi:hypothetical protein
MRLTGEGILGPPKDSTTLGSSYAVLWSWASHWNHFSNSWPMQKTESSPILPNGWIPSMFHPIREIGKTLLPLPLIPMSNNWLEIGNDKSACGEVFLRA